MIRYENSIIKDKRINNPPTVPPERGGDEVSGSFAYGAWDVKYSGYSEGLIAYECNFNKGRAAAYAYVVGSIVLAILTNGASIPYAPPIPAFA